MKEKKLPKISMLIIPTAIAFFNLLIIFYPAQIIESSKEGISLWFNNVFPSLLPFVIGTNLLTHLGAVKFLGTLLEPVMQPIFGVSGAGAFPFLTGMTSGYPMGAKTTAALRENDQITKTEAQRLMGFVNNSGPLFILGTVGIGMFGSAKAGYFLMAVHYISALICGILFKYYKYERKPTKYRTEKNIMRKAFKNMADERKRSKLTFGQLFADSVVKAMESMIQIGGFIILFSVLVKILEITEVTAYITTLLKPVSSSFNISDSTINALIYGTMEVTNGAKKAASELFTAQQLIAAACIISFGGMSIHAQSINFMAKTDINIVIYLLSKVLHAVVSLVIGILIYPFFNFSTANTVTVFAHYETSVVGKLYYSTIIFTVTALLIFITALFLSFTINIVQRKPKYRNPMVPKSKKFVK